MKYALIVLMLVAAGCQEGKHAGIAIRGATVITGDGTDPIPNATVFIHGDTIHSISLSTDIPNGYAVVNAEGKWLMPGLWDQHIHLSKTRPSAMNTLIYYGITSVRDTGGDIDEVLSWRSETASGLRTGPTIYAAGSYLESPANFESMLARAIEDNVEPVRRMRRPVDGPEAAREIVRELVDRGVDLIKVRAVKDDSTFVAIGQAAASSGVPFVGHTMGLSLDTILEARVSSIEHFFIPFLDDLDEAERRRYFREFAKQGTVFVPNMQLFIDSEQTPDDSIQAFLTGPLTADNAERAYMSRYALKEWQEQLDQDRSDGRKSFFKRLVPSVVRDVREMREEGMTVLPGTDTAVVFAFPGRSLHRELELWVDTLGFTPMETIVAASHESAKFMGVGDEVGLVRPGHRADLLLLDRSPLEDISNTLTINHVFLRGKAFDHAALDSLREATRQAPDVLEDTWGRYANEATRKP